MTIAELIIRFPEFTTEPPSRLQLALDDAGLIVGKCFGKFRPLAVAYMTAHLFTVGKESLLGNTAPIKDIASESVGSVIVSYSVSRNGITEYGSTTYGQQYEILKKQACFGSVRVG